MGVAVTEPHLVARGVAVGVGVWVEGTDIRPVEKAIVIRQSVSLVSIRPVKIGKDAHSVEGEELAVDRSRLLIRGDRKTLPRASCYLDILGEQFRSKGDKKGHGITD